MARLSLSKNITALRLAATMAIDTAAEQERGKYLTLGSGQAMVYDQKRREAEEFIANPEISDGEIPHLVAEAAKNQISKYDQAVIYLTMRQQWLTISPIIETKRLAAKSAVAAAQTPTEIEQAQIIDWTELAILTGAQ
ncbi:hypothetical protein [Ensifer sp. ENS04]|uniref:hypothetical protein n=1 Tax=Ensifer sp. ENS04 TaxID=2769281 RepID=UPI001AEE9F19|nr:hypothetical protein [Ensifer sp. ENS04]